MVAPMSGVRVIEATSWMAAPSAGAMLADMGADVIKVEPLRGDPVRGLIRQPRVPEQWPDIDYSFTVDNRGKRSVAIAFDEPDGAAAMRRLIDSADIFLCNLLPQRQDRFGLDPETLFATNPRLVHATLSGYGLVGPEADRPGFDVTTFFGRGGITDAMTEPGGNAPNPRTAQGDHTTGLALVASILAALRLVDQTGEGQVVDVSLMATAAWTMSSDLAATLVDGRQPTKRDRHHCINPLVNRFRCSDERWLILNMPEERWWRPFCETVDRVEWLTDERFLTTRARFDNMPTLIDMIDEIFASKTLAEWSQILDDAGLVYGPASTMVELASDPQAAAVGLFPELTHSAGTFRTVASPIGIRGAEIEPRGLAPAVGEHTAEVLTAAGFSADEIAALESSGSISGP